MRMSSIAPSPSRRGHHDRSPRILARVTCEETRVPPLWSTHPVFAPQAAQPIDNFDYCHALVTASARVDSSRANKRNADSIPIAPPPGLAA
jgi:hypothetical protein